MTVTHLVSLDPGTRISGLSFFRSGWLYRAQRVKVDANVALHARIMAMVRALHEVVMHNTRPVLQFHFAAEWPVVYPGPRREDPNDLLPLTAVVQGLRALLDANVASESYVSPSGWKGQRPKKIIMAHIMDRLTDEEKAEVKDPGDDNCVESTGVGLNYLGRAP